MNFCYTTGHILDNSENLTSPEVMRFEFLMVVTMNITVYWDVMCSLVYHYQCFGGTCYLRLQDTWRWQQYWLVMITRLHAVTSQKTNLLDTHCISALHRRSPFCAWNNLFKLICVSKGCNALKICYLLHSMAPFIYKLPRQSTGRDTCFSCQLVPHVTGPIAQLTTNKEKPPTSHLMLEMVLVVTHAFLAPPKKFTFLHPFWK
jgi:hypothetical protein